MTEKAAKSTLSVWTLTAESFHEENESEQLWVDPVFVAGKTCIKLMKLQDVFCVKNCCIYRFICNTLYKLFQFDIVRTNEQCTSLHCLVFVIWILCEKKTSLDKLRELVFQKCTKGNWYIYIFFGGTGYESLYFLGGGDSNICIPRVTETGCDMYMIIMLNFHECLSLPITTV